jgi:hypothetical protein
VEETRVMRIHGDQCQQRLLVTQLENAAYINYLGSLITNNARCKCEIKIQDYHGKSSIQEEEYSFQQQSAFKCNGETSGMLRLKHKFLKVLKPGRFGNQNRIMISKNFGNVVLRKEIGWTDSVKNENVVQSHERKERLYIQYNEGNTHCFHIKLRISYPNIPYLRLKSSRASDTARLPPTQLPKHIARN